MLWSLFHWVLTKYLTLLAFIITLIAIRTLAASGRRSLPQRVAARFDTFFRGLIYVGCGVLVAAVLWYFRDNGITWVSRTAIYLSLALDLFLLSGVGFYLYSLKRLRKDPDRFPFKVLIMQPAKWPDSVVVTRPIRLWLSHLAMARKWSVPELQIIPQDFARYLKRDVRLVDEVSDSRLLGYTNAELEYVPHLTLQMLKPAEDASNKSESSERAETFSNDAQRILNRALIAKLPEHLWNTSTRLCQTSPQIIATTWKQFYQQKSLRLRLASLFNTVDMLQRLIGALALAVLREEASPAIQELAPPKRNWNEILRGALENTTTPHLATLRRVLLTPREDFQSLHESLNPLREVLGEGLFNVNGPENTLAGWKLLNELRNKLIGHGGVGWKLGVDVTRNLSSLHFFFLAMMKDISRFDLGLLAVYKSKEINVMGVDQGLDRAFNASGLCSVVAVLPESQSTVELNPYFRFNDGRLLILNRYYESKAKAEYIDYNSANPLEPSFFSFPVDKNAFYEKQPDLSFTALGTTLRTDLSQNETALQEVAQKTNLAASLIAENRYEEALVVVDEVIERCKSVLAAGVKFIPIVAELLFATALKGGCLLKRERTKEAYAVARQIWDQTTQLWDTVEVLSSIWELLIEDQRDDVINEIAASLMGLGSSLHHSRRFALALICNHLAFSMYENIPELHRREVPIFSFASASFEKSYALHELKDPNQAITCYERTITLFDELLAKVQEVEQEYASREFKLDELATSVSNKLYGGVDRVPIFSIFHKRIFSIAGKLLPLDLLKSVVAHESTTAIAAAYEKYGQPEVIRDLQAKAWGNIGLSFRALDDFATALTCFDRAVQLHRELLADNPTTEHADELARTLGNKALLFSETERFPEAEDTYSEAIRLYESCLEAGELDAQLRLVRTLRRRLLILLRQGKWSEAGPDITRLLNDLEGIELELAQTELQRLISALRKIPPDGLESLYSYLGTNAAKLKELLEENAPAPENLSQT